MSPLLFDKHDRKAMALALEMARSVKGRTGDNPTVGAVVYKKGRILGMGATGLPGKPHAEIAALESAGPKANGASLAVTLEPCCHFGRTPPCTRAIIKAGIRRVIASARDPNPLVNGKGFRELEKAGIRVHQGLFEKEAGRINEDFFKFIRTGRPFVILKAGLTLNGMIAANSYDSRWITSPASRKTVHTLRAMTDAVLIGLNTALKDDPLLTVRHVKGRNPARIVLSHGPDLPPSGRLALTAGKTRTILITPHHLKRRVCRHVEYVSVGTRSMPSLLSAIGRLGIKSLLVEGGSGIFTQFIRQKCVDVFYLFMSPKILINGIPFVLGGKTKSVKEALLLDIISMSQSDKDVLVKARPRPGV